LEAGRVQCTATKKKLAFEQVLAEKVKQVVARGILDLEDLNKPAIVQIIDVIAQAQITRFWLVDNKVIFEGEVRIKIVYEADLPDQPLRVAHLTLRFADFVDVEGVTDPVQLFLTVEVEDTAVELMPEHGNVSALKVSVAVVLKVKVKATRVKDITVVTDITGIPGLKLKKETLKTRSLVVQASRQIIVRETVDLEDLGKPPFEQLIDTFARAQITDFKIIADKILFDGEVEIKVLYATPDQAVVVVPQTLPFHDFIDLMGLMPGMNVEIDVEVEHVAVEAQDRDNDGDLETIHKTVVLSVTARVFEVLEIDVVTDVAGKVAGLRLKRQRIRTEEVIGAEEVQAVARAILDPAVQGKPCVVQVIDCRAIARITKVEVLRNKILIQGEVELKVVYEAETQTVHVVHTVEVFEGIVEIPGVEPGQDVQARVEVVSTSCRIAPDLTPEQEACPPVEAVAVLRIQVTVVASRQIEVVTDTNCVKEIVIDEEEEMPEPDGMPVEGICVAEVTGFRVNVRSGPSTSFPVITQVNRGDRVVVLEEVGNWRRVLLPDEHIEGFIFGKFVVCVEPLDPNH